MKNLIKVTRKISSFVRDLRDFKYSTKSFAQFGEDLIVQQIFSNIGIESPTYLDIGANHPFYFSNSYYFYRRGCSGTLVEPDPDLCSFLVTSRPRDKILNCGVGFNSDIQTSTLYVMNDPVLNTFSRDEALRISNFVDYYIVKEVQTNLVPINKVLSDYLTSVPDLLSIDVEGLDYAILKSLDFSKFRPSVIVAETLIFDTSGGVKNNAISEHLVLNNYVAVADTRCNTIFVDSCRLNSNDSRY